MDVSWTIKKAECRKIDALKKTLQNPLDSKEIKPINPKGNQSWLFTGRTDAEAEAPILWPPDAKSQIIGKDPDAGKIEDRRRRGWQRVRRLDGITNSTRWTWVWASSRSWWWTGKPALLQSMGSQRVRRDWATELNWLLHTLPDKSWIGCTIHHLLPHLFQYTSMTASYLCGFNWLIRLLFLFPYIENSMFWY